MGRPHFLPLGHICCRERGEDCDKNRKPIFNETDSDCRRDIGNGSYAAVQFVGSADHGAGDPTGIWTGRRAGAGHRVCVCGVLADSAEGAAETDVCFSGGRGGRDPVGAAVQGPSVSGGTHEMECGFSAVGGRSRGRAGSWEKKTTEKIA